MKFQMKSTTKGIRNIKELTQEKANSELTTYFLPESERVPKKPQTNPYYRFRPKNGA